MSSSPFDLKLPKKILDDPELAPFFARLMQNLFELWESNQRSSIDGQGAVTIASDTISVKGSNYTLTPESGTTDNLSTITTNFNDQLLILRSASSANTITVKNGVGNITLPSDRTLNTSKDILLLYYTGSEWIEMSYVT